MIVNVDMDGVLADFDSAFEASTGVTPREYEDKHGAEAFWQRVYSVPGFFAKLPLMPRAADSFNKLRRWHTVRIITSPSRTNTDECKRQKSQWLHENLDAGLMDIVFASDKHRHLINKGDVLIDDTPKKIDAWNKAGGKGILFTSWPDVLQQTWDWVTSE